MGGPLFIIHLMFGFSHGNKQQPAKRFAFKRSWVKAWKFASKAVTTDVVTMEVSIVLNGD